MRNQTSDISIPASSLSVEEAQALENALFGLPDIPVEKGEINISSREFKLMSLMLNHVTIRPKVHHLSEFTLHYNKALQISSKMVDRIVYTIQEAVDIISDKATSYYKCPCEGHNEIDMPKATLEEDNGDDTTHDFHLLLSSMSKLNTIPKLDEQSGVQAVTDFFNFICKRAKLAADLRASCITFDESTSTVKPNAMPDSSAKDATPEIPVVRSPLIQMIIAGMGDLSNSLVLYLLAMTISKEKTVRLFLLDKEKDITVHSDTPFLGNVKLKCLTTETFCLTDSTKLESLVKKVVSVATFLIKDFLEREKENASNEATV